MILPAIPAIIKTLAMVGSDLPAYKALFDQIVDLFDGDKASQDELKKAYDDALAQAKDAHEKSQNI